MANVDPMRHSWVCAHRELVGLSACPVRALSAHFRLSVRRSHRSRHTESALLTAVTMPICNRFYKFLQIQTVELSARDSASV